MLLDSNVIIAYLAGDVATVALVQTSVAERRVLFASSVSVAEILSFPHLKAFEIERIRAFLDVLTILPPDRLTGEIAGAYRRQFHLSLPDAMIAASARQHNFTLVSYDNDFKKVRDVSVRTP